MRAHLIFFLVFSSFVMNAQQYSISGIVKDEDGPLPFVNVILNASTVTETDDLGFFEFAELPSGLCSLKFSYIGYQEKEKFINISASGDNELEIFLEKEGLSFDEVVVTGTKTFKRRTKSAVIVNVIDNKTLDNVQACNLSEGLKFQPGLRVETDCQTCNYTQLRMNGLAGGYSQILINGRPIFSPLTGLYGLEQLPVNMVDKIEVIRGGGSSLYGSSAIGGTVNVLTKIPDRNSFSINSLAQRVNNSVTDLMLSGNSSWVSDNGSRGLSLFVNTRDREAYDHNADNFSELPLLRNRSGGVNFFLLPAHNQKIEASISYLNEYRYGGEMIAPPAHLAAQAEERDQDVWMGSLDYQINLSEDKGNVIFYSAWQRTSRDHFTGIQPDRAEDLQAYIANPPYGTSLASTYQAGVQLNYQLNIGNSSGVLTTGLEYIQDETYDEIAAYRYLVDQKTKDLGAILQYDWELLPSLNLLSGVRVDRHNLVDDLIASPRFSLLYRYSDYLQLRASFGTGFRAPQAFDADLHIAFAGGGISRVVLSPDLAPETSKSYSLSMNYDRPTENWVAGFTLEGFYTLLQRAFILDPEGTDEFGEVFVKRNGLGATVRGVNIETRLNYDRKIQVESGLTIQRSAFQEPVQYIEGLEGTRKFVRTPDVYGFANLSFTPNRHWSLNTNVVYTGSMLVPHFAGAPNQSEDEIAVSKSFYEVNAKVAYIINPSATYKAEVYTGVKNVLNNYQSDFDIGKDRDSNYIYGPSAPRTIFLGVKVFMN